MVRDPRNADVWTTEWRIAGAGGKFIELPYGPATYECLWHDRAGLHLIWLRKPRMYDPDILLPCAHSYGCVVIEDPNPGFLLPSDAHRELAMWTSLNGWRAGSSRLRLRRVEGEAGWEAMRKVRAEIERPFGVGQAEAARIVDHIQSRTRFLEGDWFFAEMEGRIVGGIGLVIFDLPSGRLGRLQDVDILPHFQGRGLGKELLAAIRGEALRRGCAALCLRADAGDWPKDWYEREGFDIVGRWERFGVGR